MKRTFVILAVLLVLVGPGCSSAKTASAARDGKDKKLKPAPEFVLQDASGKTLKLSDFKGKVVLLDFWATWCMPCKIEIPWFMEFQRKYKDRGFSVIGVSMDESGWEVVKPFIEEMKINYPVVIGTPETAEAYDGVEVLPTTFLIDKQGRIVTSHMGLVSKDEFEKTIQDLL